MILNSDILKTLPELRSVWERVHLISDTSVPVLFFGEPGTPLEILAREIRRSNRADGLFLKIDCRVPVFNQQVSLKNYLDLGEQGTLYLQSLDRLSISFQRELVPLLSTASCRFIASTSRPLARLIQTEHFSEPLARCFSAFPIYVPPLRKRPLDFTILSQQLLTQTSDELGYPPFPLTEADFNSLREYAWPGNEQELEYVIRQALILGNGLRFDLKAAFESKREPNQKNDKNQVTRPEFQFKTESGGQIHLNESPVVYTRDNFPPLDDAMRAHIEAALMLSYGVIEGENGAAALLKINPFTLRSRMAKLGINWRKFR